MAENRYTEIFEAIRELLEERDIENITISSIAEKCHLHVSTVNYYFNGKVDMMMRFHTYVTSVRTSGLPASYYTVPQRTADAVKAFTEVIDLELFRVDYSSKAQRKLYLYLFSNMFLAPQIRDYLVEKQNSYAKFLRGVFDRYIKAGIVNPETFEEALTSMMLISTGYMFSHYYHDDLPPELQLHSDRRRLLFTLVREEHHGVLKALLDG